MLGAAVIVAACGGQGPAPAPDAAAQTTYQPYASLAQMMRAIPFTNSNIIFDTQSEDPAAPRTPAEGTGSATSAFRNVYGGWQEVENAALALSETANLLIVPGRRCENGRAVPLDREDFRRFAAELAAAGKAAYEAAQSKNLDRMVDVSGTVSEACAHCHEVYRDKDDPKDRCIAAAPTQS
jgi:hypothetical protein